MSGNEREITRRQRDGNETGREIAGTGGICRERTREPKIRRILQEQTEPTEQATQERERRIKPDFLTTDFTDKHGFLTGENGELM